MSWKPYPKISQALKLRSQVLKTISWKPCPKISLKFLPGLAWPAPAALPCPAAELWWQTTKKKKSRRRGELSRRTDARTHARTKWIYI
jgi:hypothetical protein